MDDHSRRTLAGRIARRYADCDGVRAVLIAGSVARGLDDRWSDIELMAFWDGDPAEPVRRAVPGLVTCWDYDDENDEWADDLLIDGIEVQVSHRTVGGTEAWLSDVTERHDPDLTKQDLIALIRYGIPVHGEDLIAMWRRATDTYPDSLRLAMVQAHLDFRSDWHRRKLLDRGEMLPLRADLLDSARNVYLVLLGINGLWFPHLGFKWIRQSAAMFTTAPPDLADRLDTMATGPAEAAVSAADSLIAETLTLVAELMPAAGAAEELAAVRTDRPTGPPAATS